jgi:hypothetical protein
MPGHVQHSSLWPGQKTAHLEYERTRIALRPSGFWRHDKLSRIPRCCWDGDVVLDETRVALSLLVRATFLVQCCWHENIKGIAISSNCQALETVVVIAAGEIISRVNIISGTLTVVISGRIRRERLGSISHRNHSIGRSNSCNHYTRSIESVTNISSQAFNSGPNVPVDIRPVFITHQESSVRVEDQSLGIDWDSTTSWSGISKPISDICCYG